MNYKQNIKMNDTNSEVGFLAIYLGPMYSGKTSKLQELYKQYSFCSVKTLVLNYAEDTRYTCESMMSTHNLNMIPCVMTNTLNEISTNISDLNDYKVIIINEAQFFCDIVEWVKLMISPPFNKTIHICGLDGDFQREKFGNWLDLIPHCDYVEKLTSFCSCCGENGILTPAIFSFRISKETEQKVIGSDNYIPLCRKCYNEKSNI